VEVREIICDLCAAMASPSETVQEIERLALKHPMHPAEGVEEQAAPPVAAAAAAGVVAQTWGERMGSYGSGRQFQLLAGAAPFLESIPVDTWDRFKATKKQWGQRCEKKKQPFQVGMSFQDGDGKRTN
jgi:hypothetical protein